MMRPLLTLCMIVKNEAHGIARTLQSAKPWIDRWCILDTGSTDGTQKVIDREMAGVSGYLVEGPFVDFATTRNALLATVIAIADALAERPGFLLLLDADDVLEGGEALRAWLDGERVPEARGALELSGMPPERNAFYIRMSEQACEWSSARVVRASAVGSEGWHYVGAVHEVLTHPSGRTPTITIPGVSIRHERGPVSAERMRARWTRDVELLRAAVEKDPKDARAVFYLARTYRQLGDTERAFASFDHRVALGGWREEVFESLRELGHVCDDNEKARFLLAAYAHSPHRAEPLVDLAEFYRARNAHGPAFLFASRAAALPYPREGLFIDGAVYRWKAAALVSISAWYVGEFEAGEAATRKALAGDPPAAWREALERNLRMYEERKR